tara:strand:- start:10166 stop:10930 length:765 start_codon:yes stop_codon:yes gene_type:complete
MNIHSSRSSFFVKGYSLLDIKECTSTTAVNENLKNFFLNDSLKNGFTWEEKYRGTKDLRPNVFGYDDCFVEFLFENNFHNAIHSLVGHDLVLSHIQIRKSSSTSSYMPWHRDAYYSSGKSVGMVPPAHKIIYYPEVSEKLYPMLEILEGSQLMWFLNQESSSFLSPGFSGYDKEIFRVLKKRVISADNNKALLFNTSMLHNVIGDSGPGSIRLIFSFIEDNQFTEEMLSDPTHAKVRKAYSDRLTSIRESEDTK